MENITTFENELGMRGMRNAIKISANIWERKGADPKSFEVYTDIRHFRKSEKCVKKYSTSKTIALLRGADNNALDALLYRARESYRKDLSVGEKDACHLGVFQA